MEVAFESVTGAFGNDQLIHVLTENVNSFVKWYVENELLSTHPLSKFLSKLFNKGVLWNLTRFSAEICIAIASNCDVDHLSTVADLWNKYAIALIDNRSGIQLKKVDQQFVLFPPSWNLISVSTIWSTLVSWWSEEDHSILENVFNPNILKEE